jgi:hypothetical protein
MRDKEISEDDWKVVEERLQYDIDNNIGTNEVFMFLDKIQEEKRQ